MKTITVQASKTYNVTIAPGLINNIGKHVLAIKGKCRCAIISDSNVWPLYGNQVTSALNEAELDSVSFVFPAGEASKNTETYIQILQFLAKNHFTRIDLIIALGGGVTGDIAGFAAATFLRGIDYLQVPTSLLAMVDSSVGGKTAIDLPAGKNLVGAFYQPKLVLCDIRTLDTLPENVFSDGCAEIIKYGILFDSFLFTELLEYGLSFDRIKIISRCIELKRDIVAQDEFDRGTRQLLNLGHTFGHGIETLSHYSVTHGQAVAIGMAIAAKCGWKKNICDSKVYDMVCKILQTFNLPLNTKYSAQDLTECILSDKKRAGNDINLIIPKNIGECIILPTPIDHIQSIIEAGL